jgi:hypothetical protein
MDMGATREETSMSELPARYSPLLSSTFKAVCLFCLVGLLLAAVIMLMIAPEHLTWMLAQVD